MKVKGYCNTPDGGSNETVYILAEDEAENSIKVLNDDESGLMRIVDPVPEGIDKTEALLAVTAYLDSRIDGEVSFDETEFGEPRYWMYLKNGRSIEICHEENGLPEDRQYWSYRLHCSDDEFERDVFRETMGIIGQMFSDEAAGFNGRICISKLARMA